MNLESYYEVPTTEARCTKTKVLASTGLFPKPVVINRGDGGYTLCWQGCIDVNIDFDGCAEIINHQTKHNRIYTYDATSLLNLIGPLYK